MPTGEPRANNQETNPITGEQHEEAKGIVDTREEGRPPVSVLGRLSVKTSSHYFFPGPPVPAASRLGLIEDLAQETFARLLRYGRGLDEAELKRIGRQIMANLVRDISRRRRVAEKILRECPPGMIASPEGGQANDPSGADAIELHERVVARLKGQAREYFDLALKLGRLDLTAADLMRETGATRANADQIRSRALRAYVAEIVKLGIEPPPRARTSRRRPGR